MNIPAKTPTNVKRLAKFAAIGTVLAAVSACAAMEDSVISDKFDGTSWNVVSIGDYVVPDDVDVTMNFGNDRSVSGSAGCNTYRADNVLTNDGVSFTAVAATRMMCPGLQMTTEAQFIDALSRVNTFRHTSAGQMLLLGRDVTITLDPAG